MKNTLHRTALVLTGLALAIATAGCSSAGATGTPVAPAGSAPVAAPTTAPTSAPTTPPTITVWTMEDTKAFTTLADGFTTQTGIKVQVVQIPWANVDDKLTTAVASGNGPDVVQIGLSNLPTFVSANALLDLSSKLAGHPALASSNFLDAVSADKLNSGGKVLSVPWVSDTRILFYRTDILSQAGITAPPTTWADFHADAVKLAARGKNQYGYYIPQWDAPLPIEFTWQAGGDVVDANGKVNFDTPAFKSALDFYLSFFKDKAVPTASDFDQTAGFISGAAPMVISGPYLAAALTQQAPQIAGKWAVALLPKDTTGTSLFAGSNMGIWSTSKNVDASLAFLDYLATPATQLAWYKLANGAADDEVGPCRSDAGKRSKRAGVRSQQLKDAKLLPLVPQWDKISTDILNAVNAIALQGADEQTTLNNLNATVASLQK